MDEITVEEGRQQLVTHLEKAMTYVDVVADPVEEDETPAPCFDDPDDAPDMGKARVYYVVPIEYGTSFESAQAVEEGLEEDGWSISRNEGAPDDEWMFSAFKNDYALMVSGGKGKDVGRLIIGGSSPCLPKGDLEDIP